LVEELRKIILSIYEMAKIQCEDRLKNKIVATEETKSDSDLIKEALHKILLEFRELNSNFFDISHLTQVINDVEN
jgi:hypothetical protein